MPYVKYESVQASDAPKGAEEFSIPETQNVTRVALQATENNVRYTMSDSAEDPTPSSGMLLVADTKPEDFLLEDLKRIRFVSESGTPGVLNIHYYASRIIT